MTHTVGVGVMAQSWSVWSDSRAGWECYSLEIRGELFLSAVALPEIVEDAASRHEHQVHLPLFALLHTQQLDALQVDDNADANGIYGSILTCADSDPRCPFIDGGFGMPVPSEPTALF